MRASILSTWMIAAALGIFLGIPTPWPASSADQPGLKLAVVDLGRILRDSKAAKAAGAELDKQRKAFQADVSQQEKSIRDADQALEAQHQQGKLPDDEYVKKRQDLQT